MKNYKQVYFKANGSGRWEKWGAPVSLPQFNDRYSDLVDRYFENEEDKNAAETWAEAAEILDTVGASRYAGIFKIK